MQKANAEPPEGDRGDAFHHHCQSHQGLGSRCHAGGKSHRGNEAYHEELAKAGALLDASGLHPSSKGWRITYSGGKRTVIDGPFAETKELVAGYTLIQVKSKDEAIEWTKRFPNPAIGGKEGEIEVRQLFELEDFGPSEAVERFREMGVGAKK
jgi:hypothetical protein